MTENGTPWRVMVIAMEIGRPEPHISLEQRRLQQDEAIGMSFQQRHAHMLGTTSALRLAFGHPLGTDRSGELLPLSNAPEPQHLMQCYALVNKRLCSAVRSVDRSGGRRFQAETVSAMDRACLPHLAATVKILEPTLIILQSKSLRPLIDRYLRKTALVDPKIPDLETVEFAGVPTLLANFSHPAAHSPLNWGSSARNAYAINVVAPAIRAARSVALI